MALKCNKCGTVGSDSVFQPVEGRCPNCGSHSVSVLQIKTNKVDLADEVNHVANKVQQEFSEGRITNDQHTKIINLLISVMDEIDNIIKEG